MTDYYCDYVNGSDANNGLGPDASHGTNRPWKTLTKALGAAGIASGDRVYLSPAGPFRETVAVAMTSPGAETKVIGDVENAQGFKTSGAVPVAPGVVSLTAFTTDDETLPSTTVLVNFAGRDNLTFEHVLFVGGRADMFNATTQTSQTIKFTDCAFNRLHPGTSNAHGIAEIVSAFGVSLGWRFTRCVFAIGIAATAFDFTLTTGVGSDYDVDVLFEDCLIFGGSTVFAEVNGGGTSAQRGNGVRLRNCSAMFVPTLLDCNNANVAASIASEVKNCLIVCTGNVTAIIGRSGSPGVISEDWNVICAAAGVTNVTSGGNTVTNTHAPLIHFGQERIWKSLLRQFGEPMAGSPILGFGNDGNQAAVDHRGVGYRRPSGGGSSLPAAGALERANTFVPDGSPIGGGDQAIRAVGPAYHEFHVPLPVGVAVTLSVVVKWDATYAGTKPQLEVDADARFGIAAETVTATGSSGANETLTLSPITAAAPASGGYPLARVRVRSNDTNGAGLVQADDFAAA